MHTLKRRTPGCATNLQQRVLPRTYTGVPFSSLAAGENLFDAAKISQKNNSMFFIVGPVFFEQIKPNTVTKKKDN